jgi:hypothetical protein
VIDVTLGGMKEEHTPTGVVFDCHRQLRQLKQVQSGLSDWSPSKLLSRTHTMAQQLVLLWLIDD